MARIRDRLDPDPRPRRRHPLLPAALPRARRSARTSSCTSAPAAAAAVAAAGTSAAPAPSSATSKRAFAPACGEHPSRQPPEPEAPLEIPTFHEYASTWLQGKLDGTIGEKPLAPNTEAVLPLAAEMPPAAVLRLIRARSDRPTAVPGLQGAEGPRGHRAARGDAAGADLRDRRGRRLVPLSASSIRKAISLLAMILDEALADELIAQNPARGKRMRVRVPKPSRALPGARRARCADRRRRQPGRPAGHPRRGDGR